MADFRQDEWWIGGVANGWRTGGGSVGSESLADLWVMGGGNLGCKWVVDLLQMGGRAGGGWVADMWQVCGGYVADMSRIDSRSVADGWRLRGRWVAVAVKRNTKVDIIETFAVCQLSTFCWMVFTI